MKPCLWAAMLLTFAAPSAADDFVLATASGMPTSGPLTEVRADGALRLGGGAAVPLATVVSLRRADRPLPPPPRGPHLVFANGDLLPAEIEKLSGAKLSVRYRAQPLTIPLSALAVVWVAPPDGPDAEDAARIRRRLATDKRSDDAVLLRNGDRVDGVVTGLDGEGVVVEVSRKPLRVAWAKVAAVALSTELATATKPRGPFYRATLRDGARLSLASVRRDGDGPLEATTPSGAKVTFPIAEVVSLDVRSGAAVFLSDLKPRRIEYGAFVGDAWPFAADAAPDGRPLRLGDSYYDKGLGTHGATRLTYDLGGGYRRFETLVGLSPEARRGHAVVRVLVDGKERTLPSNGVLTPRTGALTLDIDVTGGRELTLAVDLGEGGPVQDRVVWCDARLIK